MFAMFYPSAFVAWNQSGFEDKVVGRDCVGGERKRKRSLRVRCRRERLNVKRWGSASDTTPKGILEPLKWH
jgi:hypothetical protein